MGTLAPGAAATKTQPRPGLHVPPGGESAPWGPAKTLTPSPWSLKAGLPSPQPVEKHDPVGTGAAPNPHVGTNIHLQMFLKTSRSGTAEQVGSGWEAPVAPETEPAQPERAAFAWGGGGCAAARQVRGLPTLPPALAIPQETRARVARPPRVPPGRLPGGRGLLSGGPCRPAGDEAPGPQPGRTHPSAPAGSALPRPSCPQPLSLLGSPKWPP